EILERGESDADPKQRVRGVVEEVCANHDRVKHRRQRKQHDDRHDTSGQTPCERCPMRRADEAERKTHPTRQCNTNDRQDGITHASLPTDSRSRCGVSRRSEPVNTIMVHSTRKTRNTGSSRGSSGASTMPEAI